ncbi:MAG: lipase family protein, partial [Selenomonadales bacterium]|nr:lipase family protein [Selenomonadales bacterium]
MKQRVFGLISWLMCMLCAAAVAAAPADVDQARLRVLLSVACMASYEDRNGQIADGYLTAGGWSVDRYAKIAGDVSADWLVARKRQDGTDHFLLAVAGTSDMKDVRLDLKMKQVPYGGDSPESFREAAERPAAKDDPAEMRVHKGFNKLVDVLLTVEVKTDSGTMRPLIDILRENEESEVYLTGHSLGGAAVTILGARLRDMGIRSDRIHIMTFGAPAVGNAPFARTYA